MSLLNGRAEAALRLSANPNEGQMNWYLRVVPSGGTSNDWVDYVTPGQHLHLISYRISDGISAPPDATEIRLTLYVDDSSNIVKEFIINGSGQSGTTFTFPTQNFYVTSDGNSGGTIKSGTLRAKIRAINTGLVNTYDVSSENNVTVPDGYEAPDSTKVSGFFVSTTTGFVLVDSSTFGNTYTGLWAYPDTIKSRITLGARPYKDQQIVHLIQSGASTFVSGTTTIASGSLTSDLTVTNGIDNRFTAQSGTYTATVKVVQNSNLVASGWTKLTSTGTQSMSIDPRISGQHLLQINKSTFDNDPMSINVPDYNRKSTDLGFIATRVFNVRGEGQNGLNTRTLLRDEVGLVTGVSGDNTTHTEKTQLGWTNLFTWDNTLPGGKWRKDVSILSPANITGTSFFISGDYTQWPTGGDGWPSGGGFAHNLVATNPNYMGLIQIVHGDAGFNGSHLVTGQAIKVLISVFDTQTRLFKDLDGGTGSPTIGVFRFNRSAQGGLGAEEYLESGGTTWAPSYDTGTQSQVMVYYHPLSTGSVANPRIWSIDFTTGQTALWGNRDVSVIPKCSVNGEVIRFFSESREIVDKYSRHDKVGGRDFNPFDFSLYGVHKTYLNPGDMIKSLTHNRIQGMHDSTNVFSYNSSNQVTGLTVSGQGTINSIAITYSGDTITQTVETINNILSGSIKTVTRVYSYSGDNISQVTTTVT